MFGKIQYGRERKPLDTQKIFMEPSENFEGISEIWIG